MLVPLRADGKSRLASTLGVEARRALAAAMLEDVVAAARGAGIGRVVLVAGGTAAHAAGVRLGLEVIDDPAHDPGERASGDPGGLDRALANAGVLVGGDTLVLAADLPALTAPDVTALLTADADVVVAPTRGGGTAALLRRPDGRIPPAYGPGSAERHVTAGRAAGLRVAIVERPSLAHDVDRPADLVPPPGLALGPCTVAVLAGLGLGLSAGRDPDG